MAHAVDSLVVVDVESVVFEELNISVDRPSGYAEFLAHLLYREIHVVDEHLQQFELSVEFVEFHGLYKWIK